MQNILRKLKFIILLLLFLNCQGNLESFDQNPANSLYDTWIHKDFFYGGIDSVVTKYLFSYPNKLKITEYIYYNQTYRDTSDYIGTFHSLTENIFYQSLDYRLTQGDTIEFEDYPLDTIIYQIRNDELHMCFHGNSYNQVSGKRGVISNSDFYRKIQLPNVMIYYHTLYKFSTDTMNFSFTDTFTPEPPQIWNNNYRFPYYINEIYIIYESDNNTHFKGYKFYNGKLLISDYPEIYKRHHRNQPN